MERPQNRPPPVAVPEAGFGLAPGACVPARQRLQPPGQQRKGHMKPTRRALKVRCPRENATRKSRQGEGAETLPIVLHKNWGSGMCFACNF